MQTISQTLGPDHLASVYSKTLILDPGAFLKYSATWSAGSAAHLILQTSEGHAGSVWKSYQAVQMASSSDNFSGQFFNTGTKPLSVRFKSTNTVDATDDATIVVIQSFENMALTVQASQPIVTDYFSLQHNTANGISEYFVVDVASLTDSGRLIAMDVHNVAATYAWALEVALTQGATGSITAFGFAVSAQVSINASGSADGTLAPFHASFYSDSAASDPAGADSIAYFYVENAGNATGGADIDTDVNLFHIAGHTIGSGNLIEATGTAYALAEITHGARIKIGSTLYWILLSTFAPHTT